MKNEDDILVLFGRICGEQECETTYNRDNIVHTCKLPAGKGELILTRFGKRKGDALAKLSVHIEGVSDIKAVKFITDKPKKAKKSVKVEETGEEYSRGTLSEIEY